MHTAMNRGLLTFGLLALVACDPITSTPANDAPTGGDATSGDMLGSTTGGVSTTTNGSGLPTTGSTGSTTGAGSTGGTTGGGSGSSTAGGTTGGATASQIKGTAFTAKCSSYGLASNGKCAGYYCGVSMDLIAKELTGMGVCRALTPDRICEGNVSRTVGKCSREEKSKAPLLSKEELRKRIQACVYNDADIKTNVVPECLSCYLDAAQCASDHCLTQCLSGDSASCDKCRLDNNCNQPVPVCGGLPTPF